MRGEGGSLRGSQPLSVAVHSTHGAQITFANLTSSTTYDTRTLPFTSTGSAFSLVACQGRFFILAGLSFPDL
jgi:hypothetical protein